MAEVPSRNVVRGEDGKLQKGSVLNPNGAAGKGLLPRRKQEIIALKENLEYAIRGPGTPLSVDNVLRILRKVSDLALKGDVKAARLILSLAVSPAASSQEDKSSNQPPHIIITVENATIKAAPQPPATQTVVEGDYKEIPNE